MTLHERLRDVAPDVFDGTPVLFAYLYGSHATGRAHAGSDVDVAAFVDETLPAAHRFDLSLDLAGSLEQRARVGPIEALLILNDARITLAGRILEDRKVLYSRDESARIRFESRTFRHYHDFELHAAPMRRARLRAVAEGRA